MVPDISDLDPFAPSGGGGGGGGGTSSPGRIFQTPSPTPPPTSSVPPTLPQQSTRSKLQLSRQEDPLEAFSLMSLDSPTSSAFSNILPSSSSSVTTQGIHQDQISAHNSRRDAVLSDLARDPFSIDPSSISSDPVPVPPPSRLHPPASLRTSRASSSFSPPRRLSGLMGSPPTTSTSYFPSSASTPPDPNTIPKRRLERRGSIPAVSSPTTELYHPPPVPHDSVESSFRDSVRGRRDRSSESSGGSSHWRRVSGSGSDGWGDFQSAFPQDGTGLSVSPDGRSQGGVPHSFDPLKLAYASGERHLKIERPSASHSSSAPPSRSTRKPSPKPANTWTPSADPFGVDSVPPLKLLGRKETVKGVLDEEVAESIRPHLPPRSRLSPRWTLVYSLDAHGISLSTLYSRSSTFFKANGGGGDRGCVLVVRDTRGGIFGAYVNEELVLQDSGSSSGGYGTTDSKGSERYFGDGSCFLFTTLPFGPNDPRIGLSLRTFPWTGQNTYFLLTAPSSLSIGGGDGRSGLWLDSVLEKGVSEKCDTFGNDPLGLMDGEEPETVIAGGARGKGERVGRKFEVLGVEVWAVGI
ncbi:TLD-domain-containing protein [Meredithblackwellia eburnea MCA 4105]